MAEHRSNGVLIQSTTNLCTRLILIVDGTNAVSSFVMRSTIPWNMDALLKNTTPSCIFFTKSGTFGANSSGVPRRNPNRCSDQNKGLPVLSPHEKNKTLTYKFLPKYTSCCTGRSVRFLGTCPCPDHVDLIHQRTFAGPTLHVVCVGEGFVSRPHLRGEVHRDLTT